MVSVKKSRFDSKQLISELEALETGASFALVFTEPDSLIIQFTPEISSDNQELVAQVAQKHTPEFLTRSEHGSDRGARHKVISKSFTQILRDVNNRITEVGEYSDETFNFPLEKMTITERVNGKVSRFTLKNYDGNSNLASIRNMLIQRSGGQVVGIKSE